MKKCSYILLSVLLSAVLLFMGNGVTFMRCAHTGTVRMMTALAGDNMGDMAGMDCSMTSKCMSVTHVELSPTVSAQSVDYDFHVVQPLWAVLPSLVAEWLTNTEDKAVAQFIPVAWKSPPRDYLSLIRVLLI